MKKRILFLSTMLIMLLNACKKDDPSRTELLQGTWHIKALGTDANMNGSLETTEYSSIPSGSDLVETFNADKTGSATITSDGTSTTNTFTWYFQNNDQQLVVTSSDGSSSSTTQITTLTSNELMGYDISSNPRVIFYLIK